MASHRLLLLAACAALLLGACVQESRAWGTPAPPSESECRPYIEKALKEMEHHDETGSQDEAAVSAESEQQAGGGSAEDVVATAEGIDGTSLEEGQSTEATEGGDSTEEAGEPKEEAAQSTEETGGESAESEAGATAEGGESTEEAAAADASTEASESTEAAAEGAESGEAAAEGGESNEESAASTEAATEGGESAEAAVESGEPTEAGTSAEEVAEGSQSAEGDESTETTAEGGESTEDAAAASAESTEAEAPQADESTEAASEGGESTEGGETGEAAAEGGESAEDTAAVSSESVEETVAEEGESSEAAGVADESTEAVEEAAAVSSESTEETTDAAGESTEATAEGTDAAEASESGESMEAAAAEGGESLESAEDTAASEGGESAEASATESADGGESAEAAASVESTEDAAASAESTEGGESTVAAADENQSTENMAAEGQESAEATSAEATEASAESKESTEEVGDQGSTEQEATSAEEVALSAESAEQLETQTETAEELPEEDLTMAIEIPENLRPRDHISRVLKLDEESAESEVVWEKVADGALRELKRLYDTAIKPLEMLYKYRDLSNRHFGDPEIFSKPLILFMGPWSGGKSTIINYLLDNEYNQFSLRTGAEPSPAYFNILMHGERSEILDGTQLAADWTFSGLQKFGQGLLDRLRGVKLNSPLLEKVNIVEIPGILEIRKQVERMFPFNDACQWFIDRADIIFLVYDPSKLDVGPETEAILDQLKGREYQTRIILNKADQVKPEELMRVQGTLIWNISPLMSSAEPPIMYSTSLWSMPYESGAPVRLLQAQEHAFLRDLREAINKRVDNKIASARRFAVRVRNHAKMVDCYLTTYYNHKTFFGNKKKTADDITEHPQEYHIYEGLSTLTNISRYDLPDPETYRDFFKLNPLFEFQQLAATCTYFRGCPINRLDVAIAYDLPELVGKYKKSAEDAQQQYQKNLPKS